MRKAPETSPDTGIFTLWFSCNYGAILTTYALYRLLEQQNLHPIVLDQAAFAGKPSWNAENNISRAFMRRHGVQCSDPLCTDKDLQQLNEELSTFIVGSDQVWRWRYTKSYGLLHFLDFVRGDKRKIAVSSSFGIDREERPAASARKAGYFLRSFDAVSVREKSGLELLRRHYGAEGEWIPDPVFLCGTECYDELMKDTEVPQKPYLLSYVLEPNEKIRSLIENIATERGLEVINMVDAQKDFEQLRARFGNIGNIARGVTPEQWLAYIRHCAFFVTDSFHGVCFAHLYQRDFVCVAPPERGLTRFTSLLELSGLQERLLSEDSTENAIRTGTTPIDWETAQSHLNTAIAKGKAWLYHALTAPRSAETQAKANLIYELVYAGDGVTERHHELEAQIQRKLHSYRMHALPLLVWMKKTMIWLMCQCPFLRPTWQNRLQNQRDLAAYLKGNRS